MIIVLGFVLAGHGVAATWAMGGLAESEQACCCTCDDDSCGTPECCVSQPGNSAPASPASRPVQSHEEVPHSLALSSVPPLPVPRLRPADVAFPPADFGWLQPVPLFQRDCAYLI